MLCNSILVADDHDDLRETLADVLRSEGYRVTTAVNGEEALAKLARQQEPTLVLLDLMMPKMNGWEFIEVAQARFTEHPIVSVSAIPATRGIHDPTPLDTDAKLRKPIDLETLMTTVQRFCRRTDEVICIDNSVS